MRFRPVLLVTGLLPSLCYSFSDPNSLLKSLGFDFEDARERLLVERQGNRQTSRLSSGSNVIVVSITEELTVTRPTPSITITRTSTTGPVTVSPNPPDSLSSQPESAPPAFSPPVSITVTFTKTDASEHSTSRGDGLDSTNTPPKTSQQQATTTTPVPAPPPVPICGVSSFKCGPEYNGGCCPYEYGCAISSCIPPATVTVPRRCSDSSSFMCPESLGFGCCPNGYECGATVCIPPKIIPPKTITESDRTITLPAEVHTKTMVVTKAADMPISIKVQPTLFSSTSSPTATSTPIVADEASSKTQKSIRSVGIAVGVCVGILVIGFLAVLTYRSMKKRGNSDAFAIGRDHRYRRRGGSRLDLAAPTTNAFDPNGPQLLPENRYQRFSMRTPQVSQISGFDFGFHGQHGYLPHIPEEAHYGDSKYAPIPLDTPPTGFNSLKENAIEKREELYDTSVAKDSSQPLHEMEGDKPVREPAYARHLKKLGFRRSGGAGGGTDF